MIGGLPVSAVNAPSSSTSANPNLGGFGLSSLGGGGVGLGGGIGIGGSVPGPGLGGPLSSGGGVPVPSAGSSMASSMGGGNGGAEELLPLVIHLTNPEQVRRYEICTLHPFGFCFTDYYRHLLHIICTGNTAELVSSIMRVNSYYFQFVAEF